MSFIVAQTGVPQLSPVPSTSYYLRATGATTHGHGRLDQACLLWRRAGWNKPVHCSVPLPVGWAVTTANDAFSSLNWLTTTPGPLDMYGGLACWFQDSTGADFAPGWLSLHYALKLILIGFHRLDANWNRFPLAPFLVLGFAATTAGSALNRRTNKRRAKDAFHLMDLFCGLTGTLQNIRLSDFGSFKLLEHGRFRHEARRLLQQTCAPDPFILHFYNPDRFFNLFPNIREFL